MPFLITAKRLSLLAIILLLTPALVTAANRLQDFKGNPHKIGEYTGKGKWTVVMLWASDCHLCNKEAHQYVQFHKQHKNKDATVLGISSDGQEKKADANSFLKKHQVNFPNLIGEPQDVATIYNELTGEFFRGTPTFLIFSPKGKLLAQQVGVLPIESIEKFMASNVLNAEQKKN